MEKLKKINIDWRKRFKNLYVDVGSKAKNFFRLDWSKKSIDRKKQYNEKVDYVIDYAGALNDVYNNMVDLLDELNSKYTADYSEIYSRIENALKDSNSIQSRMLKFSKRVSGLESQISKTNSNFGRAGINIENCKSNISIEGICKDKISEYKKRIDALRLPIIRIESEIKKLNSIKSSQQKLLKSLKAEKTLYEAQLFSLHAQQAFGNGRVSAGLRNLRLEDELRRVKRQIDDIEDEMEDTNRQIRKKKNKQDDLKEKLANLKKEIIDSSNRTIKSKLKDVNEFVSEKKQFIDEKYSEIKSAQAEISSIAKNGSILSMNELQTFNDKVQGYFKSISAFDKLTKISDKENDYGEGFFRTISTKEKRIEKLKGEFTALQSEMEKTYETMLKYQSQMNKYSSSAEGNEEIGSIFSKLPGATEKIEKLKVQIDDAVTEFEFDLKKIHIVTIKPYYSDNLLYDVKEVVIAL